MLFVTMKQDKPSDRAKLHSSLAFLITLHATEPSVALSLHSCPAKDHCVSKEGRGSCSRYLASVLDLDESRCAKAWLDPTLYHFCPSNRLHQVHIQLLFARKNVWIPASQRQWGRSSHRSKTQVVLSGYEAWIP
ncbi:hypothetical protein P153DRAFT_114034 [Dothidotthia symphoricarpi CBS 119687]|uniref:Uncharacterized protein n=1 Tax=Dothidotthia symphoricarpi CBS 119687 TaxID=1392245 RepID=A0A6A6A0F2_9PLEO|nr:uncharacterized protein P153DRAFT_114034 [Dothidotthia symphoricarpi CBS 119687]KAF2125482.1 hypothetical protein P153DRAFT_114034 [Dothidotthia symphoricarpi CBS 119687]